MAVSSRYSPFSLFLHIILSFQRYGPTALKEIVRVLNNAYEAELAVQDFADSDADTDYAPDYEELDDEGSGAAAEAAEVRRPLIFISKWKGFFSDDVSLRLDGCSPCL